jgi:hypothetical protein
MQDMDAKFGMDAWLMRAGNDEKIAERMGLPLREPPSPQPPSHTEHNSRDALTTLGQARHHVLFGRGEIDEPLE